jgi:CubicO group peptidase (beta-lactamase class C family)
MEIATSTKGRDFERDVEQAIKEAIHDLDANLPPDSGVALAIIEDKKVCFTGGFGLRDREREDMVNARTTFAIGSATKAFTSMVACKLVEEGTIKLDDPIKKFLTDFRLAENDATNAMTLELILSHRTGLPRHDALWYLSPFTRPQLFYRLRHLDPGVTDFGRKFTYNNMMYGVAGDVLEVASQKKIDQLIEAHIVSKLHMENTTFSLAGLVGKPNSAKGYCRQAPPMSLRDYTNIAPAAAINSNAIDMAKWVLLFLNNGVAPGAGQIVSQETLQKMLSALADADPNRKLDTALTYGLGWFKCKIQGKDLFFHQGDADGHSAYVSFMPDPGLGVVVLTNQQCTPELVHKWPDIVAEKLYKLLLPGGAVDLPSVRALRNGRQPDPGRVEVRNPGDYTGMYSDNGYGDLVVTRLGSGLNISYYGVDFEALRQKSATEFDFSVKALGIAFQVPATFRKADNGKIQGVKIDFTPFDKKCGPISFVKR